MSTKGLSLEEVALLFDNNPAISLEQQKEAADAQLKIARQYSPSSGSFMGENTHSTK
jgi:hypothetical protein